MTEAHKILNKVVDIFKGGDILNFPMGEEILAELEKLLKND